MANSIFHEVTFEGDEDNIKTMRSPIDSISVGEKIIFYVMDMLGFITEHVGVVESIGINYTDKSENKHYGGIVFIYEYDNEGYIRKYVCRTFGLREFDYIKYIDDRYVFDKTEPVVLDYGSAKHIHLDITRGCFSYNYCKNNYSVNLL